jgi:hypothetical protein
MNLNTNQLKLRISTEIPRCHQAHSLLINGNVYRIFSQDASPNVFFTKPENGNYVLQERSFLI